MANADLRKMAMDAAKNSHSPYSKVHVGAAIEMANGEKFAGCNVENSSFGGTVCAERVAIFTAIAAGNSPESRKLKQIYVYTDAGWPPCGFCRQVMSEFSDSSLEIIIGDKTGKEVKTTLGDLLPSAFTPDYLEK